MGRKMGTVREEELCVGGHNRTVRLKAAVMAMKGVAETFVLRH